MTTCHASDTAWTFAVVSGAVGAGFSSADGFSMAASNYESVKARGEFIDEIRRTEEEHIDRIPDGERDEIHATFQKKGFEGDIRRKLSERSAGTDVSGSRPC